MQPHIINPDNFVNIAAMRFQPLVLEAVENEQLTIKLKLEPGIDGFIVILKPMLPSID